MSAKYDFDSKDAVMAWLTGSLLTSLFVPTICGDGVCHSPFEACETIRSKPPPPSPSNLPAAAEASLFRRSFRDSAPSAARPTAALLPPRPCC